MGEESRFQTIKNGTEQPGSDALKPRPTDSGDVTATRIRIIHLIALLGAGAIMSQLS